MHGSFHLSSNSGEYAPHFVIAGRFVKYPAGSGGALTPTTIVSSGYQPIDEMANRVLGSVKPLYASRFNGRLVQVHLIPVDRQLTDLPTWSNLDPDALTTHPADGDRTWSEVRGLASWSRTTTAIPVAVGAEQSRDAYELGHLALRIGAPELVDDAEYLRDVLVLALILGGHPNAIGCDDAYPTSDVDEYWAEGTAAFFDARGRCSEYTPGILQGNDPNLYDLQRRVYNAG